MEIVNMLSTSHSTNVLRGIEELFNVNDSDCKFSDVRLMVGDRIFYCHKLVLQLGSEYFSTFLANGSETETLQDFDADTFYAILQFLYTGKIQLSDQNIESVLSTADALRIEDLKEVCFRYLKETIDKDRALLYWRLSHIYKLSELVLRCFDLSINDIISLKAFSSKSNLLKISESVMKDILSTDKLPVGSEVEVCEMLMNWLKVQSEDGVEVNAEELLPLVRWSGISLNYIKGSLLQNKILTSNRACIAFMTKVIDYKMTDIQFEGLKTFHRPSTGIENCLLVIGPNDSRISFSDVVRVSLQNPRSIKKVTDIPVTVNPEAATGSFLNNIYVTGIGSTSSNQVWKWDITSSWIKCADMFSGRRRHCVAVVDPMLYVFGGLVSEKITARSVEKYNTVSNTWSPAGHLIEDCTNSACVVYKTVVYIFGGHSEKREPLDYVQVYNPASETCTLLDSRMPRADYILRAVLWETSVIIMGKFTCSIYNFETTEWETRQQFVAVNNLRHFGLVLDNETVYVIGGGVTDSDGTGHWTCTDEIKCVSVFDIIQNKPAVWKHHAKLPRPCMVHAFALVCLKQ